MGGRDNTVNNMCCAAEYHLQEGSYVTEIGVSQCMAGEGGDGAGRDKNGARKG